MLFALFLAIGIAIGSIGTLVGAGGGFLAMPILLLFFHMPPAIAAGTSLLMVTMNSLSGTYIYWKQKKLDFKVGILLAVAAYPGSIFGAMLAAKISAHLFNIIFGTVYVLLAFWMTWKTFLSKPKEQSSVSTMANTIQEQAATTTLPNAMDTQKSSLFSRMYNHTMNLTVKAPGFDTAQVSFKTIWAVLIAFFIGFQASLMGVGGGPLLVPALIFILGFPTHVATAISQFVIVTSSVLALGIYAFHGNIQLTFGLAMGLGAVVGAPLGAWMASRMPAQKLVYILSASLLAVGLKMLI